MMSSRAPQTSAPSIPIAVATPIDSDEDAANEAVVAAAREEGTEMIRNHLDAHLALNPGSSYVSWIAALHPENATVAIDPRFLTPGNPWIIVYQEAKHDWGNGGKRQTGGAVAVGENSAMTDASPAEMNSTSEESGDKVYGGFLDLVLGFAIVITAVSIAFSVDLIGLYVYLSAVVCFKIARTCSKPRVNILTAMPFAICWLLYQTFRLLDTVLLLLSVMIVELLAGINFFLCALLSLNCRVGRSAHQRTRRLAHLTRWAFRRPFDLEPKRASLCSPRSESTDLETPIDNEEQKAPVSATVAPVPEKEQMFDS
uniref:Transmembrane protein n=1 Tax=Pseudictyota dubia TaxID=2749911 RepID=A0A7R9W3G5_9STRA|mmetsp:Transcript_31603/g.58241  ORF Transcript_31603/g.58241 Transcript_31603/m.58241 type:complete len:313 (+) Transcript_31603:95-1033(+)